MIRRAVARVLLSLTLAASVAGLFIACGPVRMVAQPSIARPKPTRPGAIRPPFANQR